MNRRNSLKIKLKYNAIENEDPVIVNSLISLLYLLCAESTSIDNRKNKAVFWVPSTNKKLFKNIIKYKNLFRVVYGFKNFYVEKDFIWIDQDKINAYDLNLKKQLSQDNSKILFPISFDNLNDFTEDEVLYKPNKDDYKIYLSYLEGMLKADLINWMETRDFNNTNGTKKELIDRIKRKIHVIEADSV